jgi:uncharacterized protein (TIGR01244 family)
MIRAIVAAGFLLALTAACSHVPPAPATDGAPSIDGAPLSTTQQVMGDGVVVAGALLPDAFDRLSRGVRVIDLRTDAEGVAMAAAEARQRGIDYHNVPVAGATLDPASVDEVAALIDAAGNGPVLLHCASGNRAGMVWGAVQIRRGAALDDVVPRLEPLPMRPAALDALSDFAAEPAHLD